MKIKWLIELQNPQECSHKIISMIKKYLDRKLLMIWNKYNSIIIKYQKIINFLNNTSNQPTKFRTKNDESGGTYNTHSQIKYKTSRLQSILCD